MNTYHKIQSIYKRDPKTNYKTFLEGEFSRPEFEYLFYSQWRFFEKVDGTNIRVMYHPLGILINFAGRTDKAQIPSFLLKKLKEIFDFSSNRVKLMQEVITEPCTFYGEGYGARINKGGVYIPDGVDFILFDIKINDIWLEWEDVYSIGQKVGLKTVSDIAVGTLQQAINMIKGGLKSELRVDGGLAEGLVCKPFIELKDRRGRRIITKIKHRDYGIKEESEKRNKG